MASPAAVKAWLLNLATKDGIDGDANTPNKLLYMPCFWGKLIVYKTYLLIISPKEKMEALYFVFESCMWTTEIGEGVK